MAAGILRIQSFEARRSAPAAGVTVTITGQGFSASRLSAQRHRYNFGSRRLDSIRQNGRRRIACRSQQKPR